MKNPLRKRIPRELKGELGKYLVVFLLMVLTIGFVSGFLVADGSMLKAYNESFDKYNIENGNFRTAEKIYSSQWKDIEAAGVKLYENYYIEENLDNGSTMRFFKNREKVNKVCLMKGEMPSGQGEIAIDRMYAFYDKLNIKMACLIAAANNANEHIMDPLVMTYKDICRSLRCENAWMILAYDCGNAEATQRSKFPEEAYKMGKSI